MSTSGRKKVASPPASIWQSTLDRVEGAEPPTQAGEIEPGCEDGHGGGDKGLDADTGGGGYGGDAVEAGRDTAVAEPDRPLDAEIHGDPRTPEGESYPDEQNQVDDEQTPTDESEIVDEGRAGA